MEPKEAAVQRDFGELVYRRVAVPARRATRYVKRKVDVPLLDLSSRVVDAHVRTNMPPDSAAVLVPALGGAVKHWVSSAMGLTKKAYKGDFKDMALDRSSGMLFDERVNLLHEHHRRRALTKPEHPIQSGGKGLAQGAAFGGGTIAARELSQALSEGAGMKASLRSAGKRGLGGAIIGGAIGIPVGLAHGAFRNLDIYRSRQIQKQPAEARKRYLSQKVEKALGYDRV